MDYELDIILINIYLILLAICAMLKEGMNMYYDEKIMKEK